MRLIHNFVADAFYFILEPAIQIRFHAASVLIANQYERIQCLEQNVDWLQKDLDRLKYEVGQ